ncbi:MAG: hypothetical protein LUD69_08290, partial [Oscillospiraceae bacterium]|nr:hypothetical protein [Oscillospiraceae bacterium]
ATGHSYNADLTACSTCGEKIVTSSVVEDMEVSNYTVIQYMIPYEDGTVTIVLDDARLKASDGKSFAAFVSSSLINDMFMDVDGNADFTALTISIEIDTSDAEAIALGLTESTIEITLDLLVQNGNEIQLTTSTDANLTTDQLSALMVTDSTATTQNIPATSYLAGSGTKLTFKSDLIHLSDLVGTYNGDTGGYSTYLSSESYSGDGFTFYLAGGLRLKANYGGSSSYIALADFVKGVTVTSDGTLDTSNYDLYHNMYLDAYGYLIRMCG